MSLLWRKKQVERMVEEDDGGPVTHVDLTDYAVGSVHYELLQRQMQEAQRFRWPREWVVNV